MMDDPTPCGGIFHCPNGTECRGEWEVSEESLRVRTERRKRECDLRESMRVRNERRKSEWDLRVGELSKESMRVRNEWRKREWDLKVREVSEERMKSQNGGVKSRKVRRAWGDSWVKRWVGGGISKSEIWLQRKEVMLSDIWVMRRYLKKKNSDGLSEYIWVNKVREGRVGEW